MPYGEGEKKIIIFPSHSHMCNLAPPLEMEIREPALILFFLQLMLEIKASCEQRI